MWGLATLKSAEQEDRLEAYPRPGITVLFLLLQEAWRQKLSFLGGGGVYVFSQATNTAHPYCRKIMFFLRCQDLHVHCILKTPPAASRLMADQTLGVMVQPKGHTK